jgi:hypothetical protein
MDVIFLKVNLRLIVLKLRLITPVGVPIVSTIRMS